jgi:hypothetical protein
MKYFIFILVLFLQGCSSTTPSSSSFAPTDIIKLIDVAKRRYPEPVRGTFQIPIKASGTQHGFVYLNTNVDYREPTNLTLALAPSTLKAFTDIYNTQPHEYFINKLLAVTGQVKRVKIYRYKNGKRTKKFYFQTHIKVSSVDQIKVL